jgi:hypothetical protein
MIEIYQKPQRLTRHAAPTRDKWGKVTAPGAVDDVTARLEFKDKLVLNDTGEQVRSTSRAFVTVAVFNEHDPETLYQINGTGPKRRVIARELHESFEEEYGVLHFL